MDSTGVILQYVYSLQFICLLATLIIQPASPFGQDVVCNDLRGFDMTPHQVELCKQHPHLISHIALKAGALIKDECTREFKNEIWNCTNIHDPPMVGSTQTFLTHKTKEAAFVYALTGAAFVHTVAKKCMEGKLSECSCDTTLADKNNLLLPGYRWAGCSPDMEFAIGFAKDFLDQRMEMEGVSESLKHFALHSYQAGRIAVSQYLITECTSTAEGKVCKKVLPSMHSITATLLRRYNEAVNAKLHWHNSVVTIREKTPPHHKVDEAALAYFLQSPSYCDASTEYDILGVKDRVCVKDTSKPNNCEKLCTSCGKPIVTKKIPESYPCNCKFVWCCNVHCETCHKETVIHMCG